MWELDRNEENKKVRRIKKLEEQKGFRKSKLIMENKKDKSPSFFFY